MVYLLKINQIPIPKKNGRRKLDNKSLSYRMSSTDQYENYIRKVAFENYPNPEKIIGDIGVRVDIYFPSMKHGDIDNITKCVMDPLQGIFFENDKQVGEFHIYRHYDEMNPRIELIISERSMIER